MPRAPLFVVGGLVAACPGQQPRPAWQGSVEDSAGVTVVLNPTEPIRAEEEVWRIEEELRIGVAEGDEAYQFAVVGGMSVASNGDILVAERRARELRRYSSTGSFLGGLGGPGEGPGEFGTAFDEVFVVAGDTILVPDASRRVVHRFTPEGGFVDAVPFPIGRFRVLRYDQNPASGAIAVQLRRVGGGARGGRGGGGAGPVSQEPGDILQEILPTGLLGDTLLHLESGGLFEGGGLRYFTPEPLWDVTDSGTVVVALNSDYRFRFLDRGGRTTRVVTKSFEPRVISERDIRAFFAYLDREWTAQGLGPAQIAAQHERISFAEVFPAFSWFHMGPEGSLWVQPVQAPGDLTDEEIERYDFVEQFGSTSWEVFDRDGRFEAVVEMPPRFQPRLFSGTAIYGVRRDEFDVQYVVRMRIVSPSG